VSAIVTSVKERIKQSWYTPIVHQLIWMNTAERSFTTSLVAMWQFLASDHT
jgi:hypothetical protein